MHFLRCVGMCVCVCVRVSVCVCVFACVSMCVYELDQSKEMTSFGMGFKV